MRETRERFIHLSWLPSYYFSRDNVTLSTLTDIERVKRFRLVILRRFSLEGKNGRFTGEARKQSLVLSTSAPFPPCYLRNESGISGAHGWRNKFLDNQRISLRLFSLSSSLFSRFFFLFSRVKSRDYRESLKSDD